MKASLNKEYSFIPERLRTRREEMGLSQRELSYIAEFSITALSSWENGKAAPSANMIAKMAVTLDTPMEYFFGIERSDIAVVPSRDDERKKAIISALDKMKEEQIDVIYNMIRRYNK